MFQTVRFPSPEDADDGIVAVSTAINADALYSAYLQGIFPWYNEEDGEPVVWWSPDPRFVLFPQELHIPSRLRRFMARTPYTYTMDRDFEAVINGCAAAARPGQSGTWIGPRMKEVYTDLHFAGIAHSVEVWENGCLAGGFYGVLIGSIFFGESMFSFKSDSAKSAFVLFAQCFSECGGGLIDSQVYTDNIARFGARNISRSAFLRLEKRWLEKTLKADIQTSFAAAAQNVRQFFVKKTEPPRT